MKKHFLPLLLTALSLIVTSTQAQELHSYDWMSMSQHEFEYDRNNGASPDYDSTKRVKALQLLLRFRGENLKIDGVFGIQTTEAVRIFQRRHQLFVDGIVGGHTFVKLLPTLQKGSRGDGVRALQLLLSQEQKFVSVDGIFGTRTLAAVRAEQGLRGGYEAPEDGVVRAVQWWSLFGNREAGN